MTYTAPNDLFTSEEAILSLASSIADEDRTNLGNGTINGALDVLADALAERNVEVPPMNAGAILALAQYASGMVKPEGTIAITENGEGIDVAQYATADVSVSGGASTTDVYLWNDDGGLGAHGVTAAKYMAGAGSFEELQFEGITADDGGATVYGVKVKDVPAGALVLLDTVSGTIEQYIGYSNVTFQPQTDVAAGPFAPMPIDGLYAVGSYNTDA